MNTPSCRQGNRKIVGLSAAAKMVEIPVGRLKNWLDRDLVSTQTHARTRNRRFSESDVLHIALVAEMVRYGINVKTANKLSRATLGTKVNGAVIFGLRLWPDGKAWKYVANGQGPCLGSGSHLDINIHGIRNKVHAGFWLIEHPFKQTQKHSLEALAARVMEAGGRE